MSVKHDEYVSSDTKMTVQDVSGHPTQVLSLGNVEEASTRIVFIPGVPGAIGFYWQFLKSLAALTENNKFSIHAPSYPGHDVTHLTSQQRDAKLSLEEQIEHKIAFVRDVVPVGSRLILVGHSLGCFMIMQMLKRGALSDFQLVKVGLLCPVMARMSESASGQRLEPFYRNHPLLFRSVIWAGSLLPRFFLRPYLDTKMKNILGIPDEYRGDIVMKGIDFVKYQPCVFNAIDTGMEAIKATGDVDVDTLLQHQDRLSIWYTAQDHWVPDGLYESLSREHPQLNIHQIDTHHAFMLHKADEIAEVVSIWLTKFCDIHEVDTSSP
ncbi:lipid droplet-associated hydrolase-like [Corticium candelabrum]|uniref:lipid droplet-associated hydrolase-like n=1 Tax=Corticium candelabrum TaxID=121492 RepID=UPI002E276802|nr:lipid droplet-associated hydrolase-like [Corticium candelabrum]